MTKNQFVSKFILENWYNYVVRREETEEMLIMRAKLLADKLAEIGIIK